MSLSHAEYREACRAHALTLSVAATDTAFARASTARYHDVNGVVQSAAIDVYRGAHYVGATLTPLYEAAGTNVLVYSSDLTNAGAWFDQGTPNAATAPDAAMSAMFGSSTFYTFYTSPSIQTATVSVYIKRELATSSRISVDSSGDIATVAVTWTGNTPALSLSSGAATLLAPVDLGSDWWRVGFTVTLPAASVAFYFLGLLTGPGASGIYWWGPQVEAGAAMTSYIPTAATAVTRAADTGDALGATATGYTRAAGSFITDGYRAGMEVTPVGFTATTRRTVTKVEALTLTVAGTALAVQAIAGGRSLSVGLPATRQWENLGMAPVAKVPFVAERYFPGSLSQDTVGPLGWLEATAIYQLDFHVPTDTGPAALDAYADAATVHFAPRQTITADDGTVIRVRTNAGPTRSGISPSGTQGFSMVSTSFPIVIRVPNTI